MASYPPHDADEGRRNHNFYDPFAAIAPGHVSRSSTSFNRDEVYNMPEQPYRHSSTSSAPSKTTLVDDDSYDPYGAHNRSSIAKDDPDLNDGRPTSRHIEPLEYAEPYYAGQTQPQSATPATAKKSPFAMFMGDGKYPLEQRIEAKRRGLGRQKHPFFVWILTVGMTCVLIYELVLNNKEQGTPVSFKPVVNPMLGPSSSALINLGARFPPCMKEVEGLPVTVQVPCMNDTANPPDRLCSLESVCGWGGFDGNEPDQAFRFVTPIFLHAGIVHFALNMLAQLTSAAQIEREMGSVGFIITYMAAGIFGNVLGGNFALVGSPSTGASGAIFGMVAVTWVDLLTHWRLIERPGRRLAFQVLELVIGIAMGYIPYIDNFAHIGGFTMGLLVGMVFYPVISQSKRHTLIVWGFRMAAIPLAVLLFVVLIRNFYTSDPYAACTGCRYLSCLPVKATNYCKGTGFTTYNTTS